MNNDFLTELGHLGFTARIKRLNEKIVSSTVSHYAKLDLEIEPNWHVIFMLLKQRKKLTVTEIASILGFSHPAMIKITKKMKTKGFLETFKDTKDGRRTLIQLSEKGKRLLPVFEEEWNRIREILKEFVSDDFLTSLNILENKFFSESFLERYQARFGPNQFSIRNAKPSEFKQIGRLMIDVYSGLEGFPKADEQPAYYQTLANIGGFTKNPSTELLVAVSPEEKVLGAVLFFNDMQYYGSGGTAPKEKNASGFRLLAVSDASRGMGLGKALSKACIEKTIKNGHDQVIIHSTKFMKVAWRMYKKLGFERSEDLDFKQGALPVYGFRLKLKTHK